MSQELLEFTISHVRTLPKIYNENVKIDYEGDLAYLENTIINIENISLVNILKEIQLYNFSFVNIKAKGNLKSLYNALNEEDKEILSDLVIKVIEDTENARQSNKIISKLYEKNLKQKKNLKMIYNMLDIIQDIIEGNFKESRIPEIAKFIDSIYFEQDFFEDCVKQYNHITKLKGGEELNPEIVSQNFGTNLIRNVKYALSKISSIHFHGSNNFKYYNFTYTDDAGNKFICKSGQIKQGGNITILPGWRLANILFNIFKSTETFKTVLAPEIAACKKNVYYITCILPQKFKNDSVLKLAVQDLATFCKELPEFKEFLKSTNFEEGSTKDNISRTIGLIKSINDDILRKIKIYIIDIFNILLLSYFKLPKDLEDEIREFIENYNPINNLELVDILKIFDI